jgi:N-acetylmuramoyl-L-alanine amidase
MNSFGDGRYSGLQVYYSPDDEDSINLANKIQLTVKERLQKENNRVTKNGEGIYLLENTEPTSVLIECGFLTNKEECEKLSEKEYQKELSFSIVCGIIEYIEEKTK